MKRLFNFLGYFFACLLPLASLRAQPLKFRQIPSPVGSSFGVVTGITQDKEGYMWIATNRGLHRYDGYRMKSFRNDPLNPRSLLTNHIEAVYADKGGAIWIGTFGAGLYRMDASTENLTPFRHNAGDDRSLPNDTVTAITQDREGTFWIGTNRGLSRFDPHTSVFTNYKHLATDSTSISSDQVRAVYEDRQGVLWVGTGSPFPSDGGAPAEGGLNKMDKKSGTFTRYLHDPKNPFSLLNNKVRGLLEDSRGNFWVGTTDDGLHLMDRKVGTFVRYKYDKAHPERPHVPFVERNGPGTGGTTFIHEDAAGTLWIGSFYGGLNSFNLKAGAWKHYEAEKSGADDFSTNGAWWAYTSRDGVLWVGSNEGYLFRANPFQKNLPHRELGEAPVNAFLEEGDSLLWVGTDNGLLQINREGKWLQRFVANSQNPSAIGHSHVQSILQDKQGQVWISTAGGGLELFDRDKKLFIHHRHEPERPSSLSSNYVLSAYQDKEGTMWVATNKSLDKMSPDGNSFTHFVFNPNDTNGIGQNSVTALVEDRQGRLWVGTWTAGGLLRLDKKSGKTKRYLAGLNITRVLQDSDGVLWAGSDAGLFRYDAAGDDFTRFLDPGSGIDINNVAGMEEDAQKNIWMGTYNGIVRINAARSVVSIYDRNHGVVGSNIGFFASHKSRNGEIFFGDLTGYYNFSPQELIKKARQPQVVLTAFWLGGKQVEPGQNSVLPQPLSSLKELRLRHHQNVFSFEFAGIDYNNPEGNRHLYRLEGYDDTWHYTGQEQRAYYFNVPPGNYTLRVRAFNSEGMWAERALPIVVVPPWWRTWWAYALFASAVAGLIWGIAGYRSRILVREKRLLAEKVAERTAEVVEQKEEIAAQRDNLEQALQELTATQSQLIQKEKMASLGEMTAGIAHEIQNPLNFITNFAELNGELLEELNYDLEKEKWDAAKKVSADIQENNQKIAFHGKRADGIVKSMLHHSRTNTGKKEPTDINTLTDEYLRLSYHGLRAKDKSFTAAYTTDFDKSIGEVDVIPQEFGRVLLNLFNNAFYSVNQKKKSLNGSFNPTVSVTTAKVDGSNIQVIVRDNGTGISPKMVDKIFQPFFTTKPAGQGTGLGLSLSYDIITKGHGGELKVNTKEGEYTEFVIRLPIASEAL